MSVRPRLEDAAAHPHPTRPFQASTFTPPSTKSALQERKQLRSRTQEAESRDITPSIPPTATSAVQAEKMSFERAAADLARIKSMVTCGICDQLLHEPFVLGCGHTYCYSCLCRWFDENRRKKTCPECRTRVKHKPAQNYSVKSIVDVILHAPSAIPIEELDEQLSRRAEEVAEVEKDKASAEGLFKGTFSDSPLGRPYFDEEDRVMRCHQCGNEHLGGPTCAVCNARFRARGYGSDFSEFGDDDDDSFDGQNLDHLDIDLDDEVDVEFAFGHHGHHHHFHGPHGLNLPVAHQHRPYGPGDVLDLVSDEDESFSDDDHLDEDEDDNGSLEDFIVHDEDVRPPRRLAAADHIQDRVIHPVIDLVSDDESDEGGEISNGRSRRAGGPLPAVPDVLSISDDDDSDNGESRSEAEFRLQDAGWSPLENRSDRYDHNDLSDNGFDERYGNAGSTVDGSEENRSSSSSTTTETLNHRGPGYFESEDDGSLQEEVDSDRQFSPTPVPYDRETPFSPPSDDERRSMTPYLEDGSVDLSEAGFSTHSAYDAEGSEAGDFDPYNDGQNTSRAGRYWDPHPDGFYPYTPLDDGRDHDGDTDMSAGSSRESSYANAYNEDYQTGASRTTRADREVSESNGSETIGAYGIGPGNTNTYVANAIHDPEEESSESSPIRPPRRRQPRPNASTDHGVRVHNNRNPFSHESQPSGSSGSRADPISVDDVGEGWEDEVRAVMGSTNSSRNRRMTAYRSMPARRVDPLRSSRSPSSTRIIASSSRGNRFPRQYSRRG